ncbi:ADP-ribosylation factor-like protein 6-interacting protein 1 [Caerostris extrusa]|uniref:ADP-ribosylation factor-like protein 6-interacting protein 1 n=1 Tax=Caerostris extrusa TaxID=172846 RepID=A0AAV4NHU8_CAEEX|nr:ADP-ribosylation factor-like protein 6-interacting protein 1 [Caerostris extrusa]
MRVGTDFISMAEGSVSQTEGVSQKSEQELVKLCKRRLENWREVLVHFDAFLTWEKPYYPGIIGAVVSFMFFPNLHSDASLTWEKPYCPGIIGAVNMFYKSHLKYGSQIFKDTNSCGLGYALSILGIIGCVLDYVVPILSASVFDSSKWTGTQERKYEDICHGFVENYLRTKFMWDSVRQIKETKPYLYFVGVLGTLLFTAWIGNLIHNGFLTYIFVLFICLLPGIKSSNGFKKHISKVMVMINGITGQSKKNK